jgi:hypothetical protein
MRDALNGLPAGVLFYPSAGADLDLALRVFRPAIRDFWFVDRSYDMRRQYGPRELLQKVQIQELEGVTLVSKAPYRISIRHETFRTNEGDEFVVHACRGRGFDVFHSLFRSTGGKISVFFHRGDSPSEGGSNFYWLGRKRLETVLDQLEPGGLIVSDGSLALPKFRHQSISQSANADYLSIPSFDAKGCRFRCVGYLGQRIAPTLAWKTSRQLAGRGGGVGPVVDCPARASSGTRASRIEEVSW